MIDSLNLENGRLTARQADAYWNDGFLFPLPALPADTAAAYRIELEEIEHKWLDNGLPLPLNASMRIA